MMRLEELRAGLVGYKSSSILRDLILEVAEMHCPASNGFEGPDTFFACERCTVCFCKELKKEYDE